MISKRIRLKITLKYRSKNVLFIGQPNFSSIRWWFSPEPVGHMHQIVRSSTLIVHHFVWSSALIVMSIIMWSFEKYPKSIRMKLHLYRLHIWYLLVCITCLAFEHNLFQIRKAICLFLIALNYFPDHFRLSVLDHFRLRSFDKSNRLWLSI